MNSSSEKALSYLAGTESIDSITADDLQKLVVESPYFPVTQLLLAKKLKGENEQQYSAQVQKTTLYFSNPYWLQYQLSGGDIAEEADVILSTQLDAEEKATHNLEEAAFSTGEETESPASHVFADQAIGTTNESDLNSYKTPDADTLITPVTNESFDLPNTQEQINTQETAEPEIIQAEEETVLASSTNEQAEDIIAPLNITAKDHATFPADLSLATQTQVVEPEKEMSDVKDDSDKTNKHFLENVEEQSNDQPQDDEHDKMFQNIKAMLDASSEEADADTENAVIPIDPYYTIDYFASQGIKLELDPNPKDELGQNLKKFTQWLKHMKKLGPEDATVAISRTETDADIQLIADSSNTAREVVTEAMATVLEKQGKKDKAVELYNKLTFLYPHKSAYFADKIKKLKGI